MYFQVRVCARPDVFSDTVFALSVVVSVKCTSLVGVYSVLENTISFLLDTSTSSHYILLTNLLYLKKETSSIVTVHFGGTVFTGLMVRV